MDNWSTHEKLCLASIVSSLGDQNWIEISQNMKILCENNTDGLHRPTDWYSESSCALQYANLLEIENNLKKKTRSSDGSSSPITIKASVNRLKQKRMQELQEQIRKDQEEYVKIQAALDKLKSPNKNLEMLQDMWKEVEKEQEAERIKEMKYQNELRERERRKQELQGNMRIGAGANTTTTTATATISTAKQESTVAVDMDVEEIIGVCKPMQTATSPLLSSLLKSPTASAPPPPSSNITPSARTTAPTITTLLTSGTIPKSNQPAITLNTDLIPPEKAIKLLSRPISGPPSGDSNTATHTILSPSQSAPTLSMLLEKNKTTTTTTSVGNSQQASSEENKASTSKSEYKSQEKTKEDKGNTLAEKNKVENDADEPDPNEEQQLMEVFKNIGSIELDIDVAAVINDEEVDFLKGVDEESPRSTVEQEGLKNKTEEKTEDSFIESKTKEKETEIIDKELSKNIVPENKNENLSEKKPIKIETSSDDSNDNVPLAALENKERITLTPTENPVKASDDLPKSSIEPTDIISENKSPITTQVKEELIETLETKEKNEQQENPETVEKADATETKYVEDINSSTPNIKKEPDDEDKTTEMEEQIFTSVEDEKVNKKEPETVEKPSDVDEDNKPDVQPADNDNAVDISMSATQIPTEELAESTNDAAQVQENPNTSEMSLPPPPPSQTSVADTDEDSCTTDTSVITTTTKREEKPTTLETRQKSERAASQTRRSGTHDTSSKSTEDSDSSSGHRASKRSLLSMLNNLSSTKSAQSIQQALNDEEINFKYQNTCNKRLDFQTIKKSIESGSIRSFIDLQRDLLHLVQNVNFLFHSTSTTYKAAEAFKQEMQNVREFVLNSHDVEVKSEKELKETKQPATKQVRTGSRKSLRIS